MMYLENVLRDATNLERETSISLAQDLKNELCESFKFRLESLLRLQNSEKNPLRLKICVNLCCLKSNGSIFHWAVYKMIEKTRIYNEKSAQCSQAEDDERVLQDNLHTLQETMDGDTQTRELKSEEWTAFTRQQEEAQASSKKHEQAKAGLKEAQQQLEAFAEIFQAVIDTGVFVIDSPNIYNFGNHAIENTQPTPLRLAMDNNDRDMFQFLLEHGSDPNAREHTANDTGLLAKSIDNEKLEYALLLIEHGAEINAKHYVALSPIHRLLNKLYGSSKIERSHYLTLLTTMLDKGLDCNVENEQKQPAWYRAVAMNDYEVLKLMLDKSTPAVDLTAKNADIHNPLHNAVRNNNAAMVRLLLKNGDNPNLPKSNEKSVVEIALSNNNESIMRDLLEHGAKCDKKIVLPLPQQLNASQKILYVFRQFCDAMGELYNAHEAFTRVENEMSQANRIPSEQREPKGIYGRIYPKKCNAYVTHKSAAEAAEAEGSSKFSSAIQKIMSANQNDSEITTKLLFQCITGITTLHGSEITQLPRESKTFFELCRHLINNRENFMEGHCLRTLLDKLHAKFCVESNIFNMYDRCTTEEEKSPYIKILLNSIYGCLCDLDLVVTSYSDKVFCVPENSGVGGVKCIDVDAEVDKFCILDDSEASVPEPVPDSNAPPPQHVETEDKSQQPSPNTSERLVAPVIGIFQRQTIMLPPSLDVPHQSGAGMKP